MSSGELRWSWGLVVLAACAAENPKTIPASAPGNSCESAIVLDWPSPGPLSVETPVPLEAFGNHAQCTREQVRPDVLYRFTVPTAGVLVGRSSGLLTIGDAQCMLPCGFSPTGGRAPWEQANIVAKPLTVAGEVSVSVEPMGLTAQTTFELLPLVPGDLCTEPNEIVVDGGTWNFSGDLHLAFAEDILGGNGDVFFHLPVTEPSAVRVNSDASVYGGLVACQTSVAVPLGEWREARRDLFYELETGGPDPNRSSIETLQVDVRPLIPGDACDAPLELTLTTLDGGAGVAGQLTGDLALASSLLSTTCIASTPDVYVHLRLTDRGTLVARLTSTSASEKPRLELTTSCEPSTMAVCASGALPGQGAVLSANSLAPGDYLLRIAFAGEWTLDVTLTP